MNVDRIELIRKIIQAGNASSQEQIAEALKAQGEAVTQSTISRSLRKLGAIKAVDDEGKTIYRLPEVAAIPAPVQASLLDLVQSITHNNALVVVRTQPGTASLVARQIDSAAGPGFLGTIAGDDTVFVAFAIQLTGNQAEAKIRDALSN